MKGIYGRKARIAAGFQFGRFGRLIDVGGGAATSWPKFCARIPSCTRGVRSAQDGEVARRFVTSRD